MRRPRSRLGWESTACLALLAAACAVWLHWISTLTIPVVDDGGISIAFARTFAEGHGFRLTEWSAPIEGFSNPLWTFVLVLGWWMHATMGAFAQTVGTVAAVGGWLAAVALRPVAQQDRLRLTDALAALPALLSPSFAYWAVGGLENGLFVLALGVGCIAVARAAPRGRGFAAGLSFGLAPLVRPEGMLYVAAAALFLIGSGWGRPARGLRSALAFCAGASVAPLAWLAVRWWYFASLLPNTYYIKYGIGEHATAYLREGLTVHMPIVLAGTVALAVGTAAARRPRPASMLAALQLACSVVFVERAGSDWMREWRFLSHAWPFLGVFYADAFDALRLAMRVRVRSVAVWIALCCIGGVVYGQWDRTEARNAEIRASPTFPWWMVRNYGRSFHHLTDDLALRHPRIGAPDIGGVGAEMRNAQIVDIAGLADWPVGRGLHFNQDYVIDYLEEEIPPTFLEVHGPSSYVSRHHTFAAQYEPVSHRFPGRPNVAGAWIVIGVDRDHDPRCPIPIPEVRRMRPPRLAARMDAALAADDPHGALALWRCTMERVGEPGLPDAGWRTRTIAAADARSEALERTNVRHALAYRSLATVLSGENAHERRRTETLRQRLFHGAYR